MTTIADTVIFQDYQKSMRSAISIIQKYKQDIIQNKKNIYNNKKLQKLNKTFDEVIYKFNNNISTIENAQNFEINSYVFNLMKDDIKYRNKVIKEIEIEYDKIITN